MSSTSQETRDPDLPKKLKVTFLSSEWGSSKGLSTVNRQLAIQLAKRPEVDVTVFVPRCSEEDKHTALSHSIRILEATQRPGYEELELLSFPPKDLQIDIVVGYGVKLGCQAQVIRDAKQCRWIQVVHTAPEELGMFKNYQNPIPKSEVEVCEMANLVVGVGPKLSEAFRTYFRSLKKDQTVFDLTPGIFDEFASVQQVPDERKHCSILVFGCRDAEDFELKGYNIAGKAVASLPDTHLVFVGAPDGKYKKIAEQLTGCGVPAHRLRVKDFSENREDLKRLFCEVDLALMPSRTEGFGLTALEALSAGLPVLVSKSSGIGEALSAVPFGSLSVIDSEDPDVWAEAIANIRGKDRQRRLQEAEALRDSYRKKYSWAKQIKDILDKMTNLVLASAPWDQRSTEPQRSSKDKRTADIRGSHSEMMETTNSGAMIGTACYDSDMESSLSESSDTGDSFIELDNDTDSSDSRHIQDTAMEQGSVSDTRHEKGNQGARSSVTGCSTRPYTWEELNYYRLCYVITELVPAALRKVFKREWDHHYRTTLGEWRDTPKNGLDFCNQEGIRNRRMSDNYLVTIKNGNTAEWGTDCLFSAILFSRCIGSLLSPMVRQNVHQLRHVRNEIAHISKTTFTNEEMQSYIGEVSDAFTSLGLPSTDLKASMYQTFSPATMICRQERDKQQYAKKKPETLFKEIEPFFHLPLSPEHEIIRRSSDIDRIAKRMEILEATSNGAVSTIYLTGLTGCGKSELARQLGKEFFDTRSQHIGVPFVATLNAQTLETLADSYINLAYRLGILQFNLNSDSESENLISTIKHFMCLILPKVRKFSSWLVIVDNVDDLALVSSLLPENGSKEWGHGQVLITTQDSCAIPSDSPYTYHESLSKGMTPDDATELLNQMSQLSNQEQVEMVAQVLDYQPLALASAAIYVQAAAISNWEEYLKKLHVQTDKPLADVNIAFPKTMTSAIEMAVTKAIQSDEIIRHVLCFVSLCAKKPLPLKSVIRFVMACTLGQTEESITMNIAKCSLVSYLNKEDGKPAYLQVHNIVYEVIRKTSFYTVGSIEKSRCISTAIRVFDCLMKEEFESSSSQFCFIENMSKLTPHCQVLLEHVFSLGPVETLVESLNAFLTTDEMISWLCSTAIAHSRLGNPLLAKHFSSLACKLILHQNDTAVGNERENQWLKAYVFTINGKVLEQLFDLEQSLHYHQDALSIRRKLYGEEHVDVAESFHSLGTVYSSLGLYDKAKEYLERALTIRKRIFGEENGVVASSYQSLGIVCSNLGRYNEAREYHTKAMIIGKRIHGDEHGDVAASYHSLGIVCSNLGQYNQAREYHEKAMIIKKRIHGEMHGDVAASYHSLGIVCTNLGRHNQAREYHEKAIEIRKNIFGVEHGDVAASYQSLGVVYCNLGRYSEAKELYEKVLIIRERNLGQQHPDVAASYQSLGVVYCNLGRYSEAKELYEKALSIRKTIFGEGHGETAASYHNMAVVYCNLGEYNQAKDLYLNALSIRRKHFGEEHRDVAETLNSLGTIYSNLGDYNQAKEFCLKALSIRRKLFGEEHRDVAETLNSLGVIYRNLGEYNQAKEFYLKALSISRKIFGEEHMDVATSYRNLGAVYKIVGEYFQAKEFYNNALVILQKNVGKVHATVVTIYDELAAVDDLIAGMRQPTNRARGSAWLRKTSS